MTDKTKALAKPYEPTTRERTALDAQRDRRKRRSPAPRVKRRKRSAVGFLIFSGNAGRLSALNARDVANANRFAKIVAPIILEIQSSGVASNRGLARALNSRGIATARGGQWTAVQVGSILRRSHR